MKDCNHNTLEDLWANDTFYRWLNDQATESEKILWDNWLSENPKNVVILEQAKSILMAFKNPDERLLPAEINAEAARILQTIQL